MKGKMIFGALILGYFLLMSPLSEVLRNRPVALKAGHVPNGDILKMVSGEYRNLVAGLATIQTLFYYGTVFDVQQKNIAGSTPEYRQMYSNLVHALKLDPYNQDIYYFSQAVFTWDARRIKETNRLLQYGMRYRSWDWQLPYWIGFNSAYFSKDYESAARYFQMAAEISGNSLFANLAARYFHETGQNKLGMFFLDTMILNAKDERSRHLYRIRREALAGVYSLELAGEEYRKRFGHTPAHVTDLVSTGFLDRVPVDPYGGNYYFDENGGVRTTSNFSFANQGETSKR